MSVLVTAMPGLYVVAIAAVLHLALGAWFERVPRSVVAIHALLVALVLGPHLFVGRTLLPVSNLRGCSAFASVADGSADENALHDDLLVQMMPTLTSLRGALLRGELPFRDDTMGGGVPLWADQQAEAMHPLMLLSLVFPAERALVVAAALRMLLALTFSFLFFRSQCGSVTGALAGSVAFGLGGFVQLWLGWPLAGSGAWLPALLWGIRRVAGHGGRRDVLLLVTAAFGLLTAGHPETVAYATGLAVVWASIEVSRSGAPRRIRLALTIAACLAVGGALTAPVSLPSLRAIAASERAILLEFRNEIRRLDSSTPVARPDRLVSLLAPDAYGNDRFGPYHGNGNINENGTGYAGTAALLLALLALAHGPRDRTLAALAGGLLLCLLVISAAGPFGWLARTLPLLSSSPSGGQRLLLLVNFALAWLAAIAVARGESRSAGTVPTLVATLMLGIAVTAAYAVTAPADLSAAVETRRTTMLVTQLAALAVAAGATVMRQRGTAGAIVVATIVVELAIAHLPANPPAVAKLPPAPPLLAELRERAAGWRVHASRAALRPNIGSLYGIRALHVYNPIAPASWFLLEVGIQSAAVDDASRRDADAWLDALGARFQLVPRGREKSLDGAVIADARSMVVERPGARPLVRFAGEVSTPPAGSLVDLLFLPHGESLRAIARHAASIRERTASWLLADPPRGDTVYVADARFWSDAWRPREGDRVAIIACTPSLLEIAVAASGPRLLTTTELDDGGWTARADGRPIPVERTNGAFAGVRIPAGTTRVELRYRPPGFAEGVAIALLALALFAVVLRRAPFPPPSRSGGHEARARLGRQ